MANHNNPYQHYDTIDGTDLRIQIRSMIAEEIEAANLYEQLAAVTTDEVVRATLLDIANEELVHAGEFEGILYYLDTNYGELTDEGEYEFEEMLDDMFGNDDDVAEREDNLDFEPESPKQPELIPEL